MLDELDAIGTGGREQAGLAWSWSYLRHPGVLFPWLACAALSRFLADGAPTARHADVEPIVASLEPVPLRPLARVPQEGAQRERDDEARAA